MTRIFAQSIALHFSFDQLSSTIAVFQFSRAFSLSKDPLMLSGDIEIGYTRIKIIRADFKQFTGGASLCTYRYGGVYTLKAA